MREAFFGSSALMDLIHRVQLEHTGADISFCSPLAMETRIEAGELRMADMFKLYRFENFLYRMNLSGAEIKGFLEFSFDLWIRTMSSENDRMLKFLHDSAGRLVPSRSGGSYRLEEPFYNFSSAAGLIYEVRLDKPVGQRVVIRSLASGQPFELGRRYRVAVNSYRGNGGGRHLIEGAGIAADSLNARVEYASKTDIRYIITQWMSRQDTVRVKKLDHWKFVPEHWARQAAQHDRVMLFGN
jgi:2',3'-cyclic-nucleotide 2'-phosphodiesterase/3'-nucleotidase